MNQDELAVAPTASFTHGGGQALSVARAYHDGWTTSAFDRAIACLSPDLVTEVPLNHYPDRDSFARALIGFGSMVERVTLLAAVGSDHEAMLLYDMEVGSMGCIRVAEHFTVDAGRVVRLRQVHDTAAIRAAGFASGG